MSRDKPFSNDPQELNRAPSHAMVRGGANNVRTPVEPTQRAIRERAYEIYLARGAKPGTAAGDWQQAERALKSAAHRGQHK